MFRTRVTTATEELKHFRWCPAENQLSEAHNGDFVKELIGQQTVLMCNQVITFLWEKVPKQSVLDDLSHASVFLLHPLETLKRHPYFFSEGCP